MEERRGWLWVGEKLTHARRQMDLEDIMQREPRIIEEQMLRYPTHLPQRVSNKDRTWHGGGQAQEGEMERRVNKRRTLVWETGLWGWLTTAKTCLVSRKGTTTRSYGGTSSRYFIKMKMCK